MQDTAGDQHKGKSNIICNIICSLMLSQLVFFPLLATCTTEQQWSYVEATEATDGFRIAKSASVADMENLSLSIVRDI